MQPLFDSSTFFMLLLYVPPFLLALTAHEFAHGWMAYRKGDHTAAMQGRLTFNPVKHVDPIGTILLPAFLIFTHSPFVFGWARPVPINPYNFRNPRKDNLQVALAGPLANVLLAVVFAGVYRILLWTPGYPALGEGFFLPLAQMVMIGFELSLVFAVFNMVPVHPLDGSHVLEGLLPPAQAIAYQRLAPYGFILLLALMFTGIFSRIVFPVVTFLSLLIKMAFGI
jgi:Zn-dependent protease